MEKVIVTNIDISCTNGALSPVGPNVVLADVSGYDSIAAIVDVLGSDPSLKVLPTIIDLSCEYGDKNNEYVKSISSLMDKYNFSSERILPCIVCDVNIFWKELVVDWMQESIELYGFYSPCIACHLVFHLSRISLAKKIGSTTVVSGERELHGEKEKINQFNFVLDFYNDLYCQNGINHIQPLRSVSDSRIIRDKVCGLGLYPVSLKCLFSGNYYKHGTKELAVTRSRVESYVEDHLVKLVRNYDREIEISCYTLSI